VAKENVLLLLPAEEKINPVSFDGPPATLRKLSQPTPAVHFIFLLSCQLLIHLAQTRSRDAAARKNIKTT